MDESYTGPAIVGVITGSTLEADGSTTIHVTDAAGTEHEWRYVPETAWDRLMRVRAQAEYDATLEAFDRLHARRERFRRLRWLAPWPRAAVTDPCR